MKNSHWNSQWIYPALTFLLFSGQVHASKPTPEEISFKISQSLKPIDDAKWAQIAGDKILQEYGVAKGDNLYNVSQRLFGDPKYWPKIWSMNNKDIHNPHFIKPGQKITFQLGTGTTLPKLELNQDTPTYKTSNTIVASNEWEQLPTQRWERVSTALPAEIDPLGFDKNSKIRFGKPTGIDLFTFVSRTKTETLGTIQAALNENAFMTLGQRVYIKSKNGLEIGKTYAVATDEFFLRVKGEDSDSPKNSYAYLLNGRVNIVGHDGTYFVGKMTMVREFIPRGATLVEDIPSIKYLEPVAGSEALPGKLFRHPGLSTSTLTQHKFAYVNLGSADGIQPGMYFKSFQHNDLNTGELITKENTIPSAEMQVMQVTDHFCTVMFTNSTLQVEEGGDVELVTDLSTLLMYQGDTDRMMNKKIRDVFEETPSVNVPTAPSQGETDELESLDQGEETLTDDQKNEIRQLEKHQSDAEILDEATKPAPIESAPTEPPTASPMNDGLDDGLDQTLKVPDAIQEVPSTPPTESIPAETVPSTPATPKTPEEIPSVDEGDLDQLLSE